MIRKLFALLALVGLAAAPTTGWALGWNHYAQLDLSVIGEKGGLVCATTSSTTPSSGFGVTSSSGSIKSGSTSLAAQNITIYAHAQISDGWLFVGWFENAEGSGDPTSKDNPCKYTINASSTSSGSPTKKTLYAKFEEKPAIVDLNAVDFSLSATSFNFDGTKKEVTETVTYGGVALVRGTHYTITGTLSDAGSASKDTTYNVTITAIDGSGYTGTRELAWTIKAPTGTFETDALSTSAAGCTASGNTVSVSDSTKLAYVAENTWRLSAVIKFPKTLPGTSTTQDDGNVKYIDDAHALIETTVGSVTKDIKNKQYKIGSYVLGDHNYIDSITWTVDVPLADIMAAIAEQKTALEYEITVAALAWTHRTDGLKPTTYTLSIPLEGIKLNDDVDNQVYPELPYVAKIGAKKYLTLAEALGAAKEGQTIEVFAAAEQGTFTVPMGVTVNLGANGAVGSTYELLVDDDHLGDAGAKIISTKAETVETATGFGVKEENFTYTLYRAHQHSWSYALNGATLTATCQAADCDVPGATVAMSIKATSNGDGQAPTLSYEGKDDFVMLTDATVGEITVTRPSYSKDNWYVGTYTASCVVTVGGQSHTLTQNFEILKPEGGYTSGFEAQGIGGGYDVRFNTFAEAAGAANAGDTIYYRGGDLNQKEVYFSSAKDITLNLGGKTITCQSGSGSVDGLTIINSAEGTVTLKDATIVQPYGRVLGVKSAKQVTVTGKFIFDSGIVAKNEADNKNNYLKITADNLKIVDGTYQAEFAGTVEISGGKFWSNDKPTALAADHIVREIEGDYKYEVVEHHHTPTYAAEDNVITATCGADDHEFCGFGTQTLTLNVENEKVSGQPYSSASIAYSDGFPVKDAVIAYFSGDQELPSAPTETGDYVAKVTVGGATAEAPFAITHIHQFNYDALDAMTIGVTCRTEIGTCDFRNWKRATLTASDSKVYDNTAYTASFTLEEGFPTDYVTVSLEYWVKNGEKLDAAPSAVGSYTVKMIASEGGTAKYTLEKDFAIVQADLAGATITLSPASHDFDGTEKSVTVSSVKLGNLTLTEGVDYTISEGSVFKATGEGVIDETFTVMIEGVDGGNFTGKGSTTWKIVAGKERDDFKFGAGTAGGEYGEVADKTLSVTDSTKLVYNGDGTWSMAMTVTLPTDGNVGEHFVPTAKLYFRNPQTGEIVIGSDADACKGIGVDVTSAKTLVGDYYYVSKLTWTETVSLAEIEAAIAAGDEKIVRTLKMWSPKWEQEIIKNVLTYDNHNGLPVTEYRMELPLADLVLPVPAGATLDMAGTKFASEDEYEDYPYQLQLGAGAKVYGDPEVDDGYIYNADGLTTTVEGYEVACVDVEGAQEGECAYYFTTLPINYNIGYSFVDTDGNTLTDVTNPYSSKKTYTIEDEVAFTEPASLDGYEFVGWSPVKIEKGATGERTITGTFRKSAITIMIAKDTGIADVQTNGVTVVGELELPAETKTVELTLVKDTALVIPVYKVTTNGTTTVTTKTATYAIAAGDTLTFFAEEAKVDDPNVSDKDVADAIIAAVDPGESHDAAVANIETVIGGDEPKVEPKELAKWITDKSIRSVDIAESDYLAASVKLDTPKPITDETEVKVETFENVSAEGFELSITIKIDKDATPEVVKAAKEKVVGYIQAVDVLGNEFGPVDANRVEIDLETGKVTITPAEGKTSEFFKIVIPKDK